MSITTSREDRLAAIARLAELDQRSLERDLAHWAVTSHETAHEFHELNERLGRLRDLHAEEEAWVALHADELRRRRAGKRGEDRA